MGWKGFVEGGLASVIAGAVTHPLDLIKVRMQLQGEATFAGVAGVATRAATHGPLAVAWKLVQTEGVKALYSGVSAAMLRQLLYSSTRIGLYDMIKLQWSDPSDANRVTLQKNVAAGLIAGAIGAAVGNPADVAMVRMQADGRLPPQHRRNYKGAVDAIGSMIKKEGVASLWTGSTPTIHRAMLVTASQLASYDYFKEKIVSKELLDDGVGMHMAASFLAGFVASITTNPIDVVKTRLMNMKVGKGQPPPYRGALDCAIKTIRLEGPMALYKGFVPTVARQGPFAMVLFVSLEQIRTLFSKF